MKINLPVIFGKVAKGAKALLGNVPLLAKKHSPELMLAAGGVSFVLTIVETVRATTRTNDILNTKDRKMELIEEESRKNLTYTSDIRIMDEKAVTRNTRIELVKIWVRPGLLAVATLVSFGGVYKIINGRYVAASAAYEGLDQFVKRYRQNVVDEFGNEVDWRMAHSIKAEEMAERRKALEEAEDDGKKRCRKNDDIRTQYSKGINNAIFDAHSSSKWRRWWLPVQVIDFVRSVEADLQSKVDEDGSAMLNDAYDRLGMPRTAQGAIVGWVKRPGEKHDQKGHYVSLGFANDETPESEIRRILAAACNDDIYVWITPNCDGVIYNMIDMPFSER